MCPSHTFYTFVFVFIDSRLFYMCLCVFQDSGSEDECIPIGDFSFDPHKLICCSLESGNVLSHGSGGKGYGLATTAITSGCFIWKVPMQNTITGFLYRVHFLMCVLSPYLSFLSLRRTGEMKGRVSECPDGPSGTTTIAPPQTCGCTGPTVVACIMEENWAEPCPPSPRVTQ